MHLLFHHLTIRTVFIPGANLGLHTLSAMYNYNNTQSGAKLEPRSLGKTKEAASFAAIYACAC